MAQDEGWHKEITGTIIGGLREAQVTQEGHIWHRRSTVRITDQTGELEATQTVAAPAR